jgi:predicted ribonuclease YlaK
MSRGVEYASDEAILVTECQSIDPYTIKTIVQRCKSGCKQFYEGDMLEQSDKDMPISGMKKMLDIFKGYKDFACIKLKYNYRNPVGELADQI